MLSPELQNFGHQARTTDTFKQKKTKHRTSSVFSGMFIFLDSSDHLEMHRTQDMEECLFCYIFLGLTSRLKLTSTSCECFNAAVEY